MLTDLCATVTVPRPEYESLVRKSERLDCLERFLKTSDFINSSEVAAILKIEKKGESNDGKSDS